MEIKSRIELPLLMKHFGLPMIAVEVGVAGGSNSADMLKNGIEKLYCVDAWDELNVVGDGAYPRKWHEENYELTLKLLSQFDSSRYVILRAPSNEAHVHIQDNSLGLVYLDGNHEFQGVRDDIRNYYPKLVYGGIMGFHDYQNLKPVRVAVKEWARLNFLTIHDIPETSRGDAGCWFTKNDIVLS